jgi:hypothetical protein
MVLLKEAKARECFLSLFLAPIPVGPAASYPGQSQAGARFLGLSSVVTPHGLPSYRSSIYGLSSVETGSDVAEQQSKLAPLLPGSPRFLAKRLQSGTVFCPV